MKRIKADISNPPVKRIRVSEEICSTPAKRVRSNAPQTPPAIKRNEKGVREELDGTYRIMTECDGNKLLWPCTVSGFLKDHRTPTHVSHYGRLFRLMTEEESLSADTAIKNKMKKCFPNSCYQRGKIPLKVIY